MYFTYENSCLHLSHCTWLRCIRSCTKNLNHGFLENKWLVHNWFMGLGNPLKFVVHHLLIGGMVGIGYRDGFPMVSAPVCMVTHWTGPTMSHDLKLSSSHDLIKLLHCVCLSTLREYWACSRVSNYFDLRVRLQVDHIFLMNWVIIDGNW